MTCTYRTGAAGALSAGQAMAAHLLEETLTPEQAAEAQHYQGIPPPAAGTTAAEPRRDMDPRLATLLRLDQRRCLAREEVANLLSGLRADGGPIPGKRMQAEGRSLAETLVLDPGRVPGAAEIDRLLTGRRADDGMLLEAVPGNALARLLEPYGLARGRTLSPLELQHVRAGRRVDGMPLRPGLLRDRLAARRARIAYIDLTLSADKSVSVAWALAPTTAERAIVVQAHRDAVTMLLRHVQAEIGRARRGRGGQDGFDPGHVAWVQFDHYVGRPTVEVEIANGNGEAHGVPVSVPVPGDPQLHSHVAIPNLVVTEQGRVGSLDLARMAGRVHEFGALYHAYLATGLRRYGVKVVLDQVTGAARLPAIPDAVREAFSKRTRGGVAAARAYARGLGLDWDGLDAARRIGLAKAAVQGDPRQVRVDDLSDEEAWRRQAAALGWIPRSVLRTGGIVSLARREVRLDQAYSVAADVLQRQLRDGKVPTAADARVAAARGLVASGVEDAGEIGAVTHLFVRRGLRLDGSGGALSWAMAATSRGESEVRPIEALPPGQEAELASLCQEAVGERAEVLPPAAAQAMSAVGSGRDQEEAARIMRGGRLTVAIARSGIGAHDLLRGLLAGWVAAGRNVRVLEPAAQEAAGSGLLGLPAGVSATLPTFLRQAGPDAGPVLGRSGAVVVRDLARLGARQLLDLARQRQRHGFHLVLLGDHGTCGTAEAAPVVAALCRALSPGAVQADLDALRRRHERKQGAAMEFQAEQAEAALALKCEDGTALLLEGGHDAAVADVAGLWWERHTANRHDPGYRLTIAVPEARDALAVEVAIRRRRRAEGDLGPDLVVRPARGSAGDDYDLALARGDRVRLQGRTNASYADRTRGLIGAAGSVLDVVDLGDDGITFRNAQGREGVVRWATLLDKKLGRVRLDYGTVLPAGAGPATFGTEHILALPSGSRVAVAAKSLAGIGTRGRVTFLALSAEAEREEVGRRGAARLGAVTAQDIWANAARNLSAAPDRPASLVLLERACEVWRAVVHARLGGLQPAQARQAGGIAHQPLLQALRGRREEALVATALVVVERLEAREMPVAPTAAVDVMLGLGDTYAALLGPASAAPDRMAGKAPAQRVMDPGSAEILAVVGAALNVSQGQVVPTRHEHGRAGRKDKAARLALLGQPHLAARRRDSRQIAGPAPAFVPLPGSELGSGQYGTPRSQAAGATLFEQARCPSRRRKSGRMTGPAPQRSVRQQEAPQTLAVVLQAHMAALDAVLRALHEDAIPSISDVIQRGVRAAGPALREAIAKLKQSGRQRAGERRTEAGEAGRVRREDALAQGSATVGSASGGLAEPHPGTREAGDAGSMSDERAASAPESARDGLAAQPPSSDDASERQVPTDAASGGNRSQPAPGLARLPSEADRAMALGVVRADTRPSGSDDHNACFAWWAGPETEGRYAGVYRANVLAGVSMLKKAGVTVTELLPVGGLHLATASRQDIAAALLEQTPGEAGGRRLFMGRLSEAKRGTDAVLGAEPSLSWTRLVALVDPVATAIGTRRRDREGPTVQVPIRFIQDQPAPSRPVPGRAASAAPTRRAALTAPTSPLDAPAANVGPGAAPDPVQGSAGVQPTPPEIVRVVPAALDAAASRPAIPSPSSAPIAVTIRRRAVQAAESIRARSRAALAPKAVQPPPAAAQARAVRQRAQQVATALRARVAAALLSRQALSPPSLAQVLAQMHGRVAKVATAARKQIRLALRRRAAPVLGWERNGQDVLASMVEHARLATAERQRLTEEARRQRAVQAGAGQVGAAPAVPLVMPEEVEAAQVLVRTSGDRSGMVRVVVPDPQRTLAEPLSVRASFADLLVKAEHWQLAVASEQVAGGGLRGQLVIALPTQQLLRAVTSQNAALVVAALTESNTLLKGRLLAASQQDAAAQRSAPRRRASQNDRNDDDPGL